MLNEFLYLLPELRFGIVMIGITILLIFVLWFMESLDVYLRCPKEERSRALFWKIARSHSGFLFGIAVLLMMCGGHYYDIKSREIYQIQKGLFDEWLAERECVALNQGAMWSDHVFQCGGGKDNLCAPSHRNMPGDFRNAWTCESGEIVDIAQFEDQAREIFRSQVQ